jgi:hypothetical protein
MTQQDDSSGASRTGFGGEPTAERSSETGWDADAVDEDSVTTSGEDEEAVADGAWSGEAHAATPEAPDAWAASADATPGLDQGDTAPLADEENES